MNTGTARIVIIAALLVSGVLLIANAFDDPGVAAQASPTQVSESPGPTSAPSSSGSQQPSPEPTPDPAAPKDTVVAVFNGTTSVGLAGIEMDKLTGDGYQAGQDPADAPNKPVDKTIVYFAGGPDAAQNESNATDLASTYYPSAKVKELSKEYSDGDLVDRSVQVVVVVGLNDAPGG